MRTPAIRGLGAVAAIAIVVLLALLAATVVRMGWSSHTTQAQALLAARANQAARAGVEWGLHQLLKGGWAGCSPAHNQTLDLGAELGMRVAVSCSVSTYNEGADELGQPLTVRVYQLEALACSAASCPDNAAATGAQYVERLRRVTVSDCVTVSGAACP
jgi:MSHA biogenesis protein MshP